MTISVDNKTFDIDIKELNGKFFAIIDGNQFEVKPEFDKFGQMYAIIVNGKHYEVRLSEEKNKYKVNIFRNPYLVSKSQAADKTDEKTKTQISDRKTLINSPMSGLVIAIHIKQGQIVDKGESLIVLEAMKMQNDILSPIKAKVSEIFAKKGQTVEKDNKLLVLEPINS
jgi:biotin carboxyl carrier protein